MMRLLSTESATESEINQAVRKAMLDSDLVALDNLLDD